MELRTLGRTGMLVAPIGLGTVKIGRSEGLKYTRPPRIPDDDEVVRLLRCAADLGVNLIDTAPAYGSSEERLGRLMTRAGRREDWLVCTKVGEEFDADAVPPSSRYDFHPATVRRSVERSLARLGVEHLDVVLLHFSSGNDLDLRTLREGEALGVLRDMQSAGLIGAVGASTGTVEGGMLAANVCDVVMVTMNRYDQSQMPVIEAAVRHGCGVLLKKALASGRAGPETLGQLLSVPGVSCAVIGTTTPDNLRAAVTSVQGTG